MVLKVILEVKPMVVDKEETEDCVIEKLLLTLEKRLEYCGRISMTLEVEYNWNRISLVVLTRLEDSTVLERRSLPPINNTPALMANTWSLLKAAS